MEATLLVLGAVLIFVLFFLGLAMGLILGKRGGRLEAEKALPVLLAKERGDAVKRSRAILSGLAAEQLAPWLEGFPFDPTDCRFLGSPVDFLAFRGASRGVIEEVVFVEVKSGNAGLSPVERSLREAIEARRVSWLEYRVPGP